MFEDIEMSAASLYNGGWRSEDADQLKEEYQLIEEETEELVEALRKIESQQ